MSAVGQAPRPPASAASPAADAARRPALLGRLGALLEVSSIRVVIAIAVIWTIFQIANEHFLDAANLTNLMLQIAATAMISIGVTLVLLLGEIDLSVGSVSGMCAAIMAVLLVKHDVPQVAAVLAGLAAGGAVGWFQGTVATKVGVPPFVVTLAGFLGWQGVLLYVLGDTGTVNLPPGFVTDLTNTFFDAAVGWVLVIALVAFFVAAALVGRRRRRAAGLEPGSAWGEGVRLLVIAGALVAAIAVLNADRGLPLAIVILVGVIMVFDLIVRRSRFGRHLMAVGGNAEAARRAGIRVDRLKITVFALAGLLAAAGGVLAGSRLLAVNQGSGSGDVLLLAIAGPVIAGTSLFGGRGNVWSALLGALVIGSISNGMDLLALDSSIKFMVTGGVLLAAVALDAATNRVRAGSVLRR